MATSQMPSISVKDPITMWETIANAGRVKGAENKPLKLSEDGIITTAIEIVFNNKARPITTPCFANPLLSLTIDTPPIKKMKMAI